MGNFMNFENDREDIIEGRNAVIEALRAGRAIDKIYLQKGDTDKTLGHIASKARGAGCVVVDADRRKLDAMSFTHAHQGVIAVAAAREYCTVKDILEIAAGRTEQPFIIVCDEISDPQNLGAIIRTAEATGVHGIVIPKRRSAGVTSTVVKASAGAAEHMAVARVSNLSSSLKELKEAGLWIYGTAAEAADTLWETDFSGPVCIVLGSEGQGMSRLVTENCDFLVGVPMKGKVTSLNVSATAAVLAYEVLRQRAL